MNSTVNASLAGRACGLIIASDLGAISHDKSRSFAVRSRRPGLPSSVLTVPETSN